MQDGMALLRGVEVGIEEDGPLDLPDDVLADWFIACVNYGTGHPGEQIMKRLLSGIRSPYVLAIGRPTGRLLGTNEGHDLELEVILRAAADYGCMIELNSQPHRLTPNDETLIAAKERGVLIVVNA